MGFGIRRVGSQWDPVQPRNQGSQAMETGSAVFFFFFFFLREGKGGGGIRDQAEQFLCNQQQNFVTLLESRIRNSGTKMGSAVIKTFAKITETV